MEGLLSSDSLLADCFNHYLSLPILPLHLHIDLTKQIINEVSDQDAYTDICARESNPKLYNRLMEWIETTVWPFFLKSMSYCKYRLCCTLGTEEGEVADITFVDFLNFERNLKQTVATSLIEVWACCEAHTMGVEQQWAQIHAIRAHCVSLPFLTTEVTRSGNNWIQLAQDKILQRLKWYWLPRFSDHCLYTTSPNLSRRTMDQIQLFYDGLLANYFSGDPFSKFLSRKNTSHWLFLWQYCHYMLCHVFSEEKYLTNCWRMWSTYIAHYGKYYVNINSDTSEELHAALQSRVIHKISSTIRKVQGDIFSFLKRWWTAYQKELYSSYMNCFGMSIPSSGSGKSSHYSRIEFKHYRKKLNDPKELLPSDFEDSVFQPLANLEAFLQFEQYIFISRGPLSEENACLKLWKAIKRYNKTLQADRRDSLAAIIHRNFISDKSKYCLSFPQEMFEVLDQNVPYHIPNTAILQQLQQFAEENLNPLVEEFILSMGEQQRSFSAMKQKAQLLSMALALNKKRSNSQLQEDALHLHKTLSLCEGPITNKLRVFSEYLVEYAYPSSPVVMANNVQFWLEVNKFKIMYNNDASIDVLYHKGEALVDRYLDTATPPWIKISISSEMAMVILSAIQELHRYKLTVNLNHVMDLFDNAQQRVFSEIVPYWGTFCRMYQSPVESTTSLPEVVKSIVTDSKSSLNVSKIHLPPLPRTKDNMVPVLSYSKLTGIKWRRIIDQYRW